MAIAAVAHVFVFSAEPYRVLSVSEHGKVSSKETKAVLKLEEGGKEKPALLEKTETQVESPGTSVRESVQDIVIGGGEHVIKDVALTINQAIEPVEKGVTKIQETFHHISKDPDDKEQDSEEEVEYVEKNIVESGSRSPVVSSKKEVISQTIAGTDGQKEVISQAIGGTDGQKDSKPS